MDGEGRFHEMSRTLAAEPNTLAYPAAALFAFCLGLVASNAATLVRAAHRAEAVEGMSWQEVASEVRRTHAGMRVAIPPAEWERFGEMAADELAAVLRDIAGRVRPAG